MACIPNDFPDKGENGYKSAVMSFSFDKEVYERMTAISNKSDFALFIILLSGVKYILHEYTQNSDVLTIMPVFKQNSKNALLINSILPLLTKLDRNRTFKEYLNEVKNTVVDANANQNFPIMSLIDLLNVEFDENGLPILGTVVSLDSVHDKEYIGSYKADTLFYFYKDNGDLRVEVEYNSNAYGQETISQFVKYLFEFFDAVLKVPEKRLIDIEIIPNEERQLIKERIERICDSKNKLSFMNIEEIEEKLIEIWQDLLGVERDEIENNSFFELGGNSMLAIKLEIETSKKGIVMKSSDIYKFQTVKELSAYIASKNE
ncbi:MAG: condensation domain-containing protein [Bacillota bacterium]